MHEDLRAVHPAQGDSKRIRGHGRYSQVGDQASAMAWSAGCRRTVRGQLRQGRRASELQALWEEPVLLFLEKSFLKILTRL